MLTSPGMEELCWHAQASWSAPLSARPSLQPQAAAQASQAGPTAAPARSPPTVRPNTLSKKPLHPLSSHCLGPAAWGYIGDMPASVPGVSSLVHSHRAAALKAADNTTNKALMSADGTGTMARTSYVRNSTLGSYAMMHS